MLFKIGHMPLHELNEQGNRESRFAMPLTPNHALVDQLLAYSGNRCSLDAKCGRNFSSLQRSRPKFRHATKIFLLKQCQTVESHSEEVGIQMGNDARRGLLNMSALNGACRCRVPDVEAPFLNEVRISLRHMQNFLDCVVVEISAFVPRWIDERSS